MRITKEQKDILDSLICERLSAHVENEKLIETFVSRRGASLVNYFHKFGMEEDKSGSTAYYIIKNKDNELLMFFSLKCGTLFEPLQDEEEAKRDFQRLITIFQAIENAEGNRSEDAVSEANEILNKYQIGDRISIEDFNKIILKKAKEKKNFLKMLFGDKEKEDNDKIFRVQSTHPGIELVHFCANDNLKEKWKKFNMGHTMGEILYWEYIVPKFFEIQKIAGCKYAFLFAADLSEDESLINYYNVALKFKKSMDVGTNKPFYDFCCDFMCQEVNEMKKGREYFFEHFNTDATGEIV